MIERLDKYINKYLFVIENQKAMNFSYVLFKYSHWVG